MANRFPILLLTLLLISRAQGQEKPAESMPDMDLVESEDLEQMLKESAPAESATAPTTEAVTTSEPIVTEEPPALEDLPSEAPTPVLEATAAAPIEPTGDDTLANEVKAADPALPEPLPLEEGDDLDTLKADLQDTVLENPIESTEFTPAASNIEPAPSQAPSLTGPRQEAAVVNDPANLPGSADLFDTGKEEKELLSVASSIQGQISNTDWNELSTQAQVSTYTVVKNDWLFKISKRLFGSGFYYPKIWSLNPFITNPHLIEPGMVLHFSTGSANQAPEVKLGAFADGEVNAVPGAGSSEIATAANPGDFSVWGEDSKPQWMEERKNLVEQGVYVQYSTGDTILDLEEASKFGLVRDYEAYEPPANEFFTTPRGDLYDSSGLDKNSKIVFKFKEGYYLNTFVTNNPVQDFGLLEAGPDENTNFLLGDRMYLRFDEGMNILPGDRFSLYAAQGKVTHVNSDRSGNKYTILGTVKIIGNVKDNLWEAEPEEITGPIRRGSRITVHTPRIERLIKTFSNRTIEAAVVGTHGGLQQGISFGDVVYIDRGRADGIEMGNVFELFGFKDRSNGKLIAEQPTYKTGELTVITLTDNFATCLVTNSKRDFYVGDIAVTKTKESALRASKGDGDKLNGIRQGIDAKALDELDVELKVEDLNDSLLEKADKIQLNEDELAELERQEREKSVIKDSERDLKALERFEKEIEGAEKLLNEAKLDEDKLLETQSLDEVETQRGIEQQESLNEIEDNLGKRYLDEDLNNKDNPYGLTEFDIEEIDELLNVEKPKE